MNTPGKSPNPQGKGLVPLLNEWGHFQPQLHMSSGQAKALPQLLAEYFSSLLVLSTHFQFKPVRGKKYYLYFKNSDWRLSMIEPQRWSEQRRGYYLGCCRLQQDMTWTIDVTAELEQQPQLLAALHQFQQQLVDNLNDDISIQKQLPFYVASLPFYARLSATGLAKSLSQSFSAIGMLDSPSQVWLEALD